MKRDSGQEHGDCYLGFKEGTSLEHGKQHGLGFRD